MSLVNTRPSLCAIVFFCICTGLTGHRFHLFWRFFGGWLFALVLFSALNGEWSSCDWTIRSNSAWKKKIEGDDLVRDVLFICDRTPRCAKKILREISRSEIDTCLP